MKQAMNNAAEHRAAMVDEQIACRGVRDRRVPNAMRKVPRERFVRPDMIAFAYDDGPLPIAEGQVREITEMKRLIARLEAHPTPNGARDLPSYRDKQVPPSPPETDESAGVNTLQPIR